MKPKRCSVFFAAQVVPGAPSSIPGVSASRGAAQANSNPASHAAARQEAASERAGREEAREEGVETAGARAGLRRERINFTGLGLIGHFGGHVRPWFRGRGLGLGALEEFFLHHVALA